MVSFGFHPVPKPKHKRNKPTAKQRGAISKEVYAAALERSGGCCEQCGSTKGLQCAHLLRRWQIEGETTVNDVAMLCGPSVNSGTCHHYVDYTAGGKQWAINKREEFYSRAFPEIPGNSHNNKEGAADG
ncbi:hypothetical protein [Paenibacillus sp. FSL H3-0469]|uniref:hypothetical protein n=1 Tax=Paenibacillus sp. FSL H3-0469 TaxID=2954506 RepID=UPI003100C981